MFGFQFYPTPEKLAIKMYEKVNWSDVQFILEPSAGKGDLIEPLYSYLKSKNRPYGIHAEYIELDENLRSILKERNKRVVGEDFLKFSTYTRYDLILMNPPFKYGDRHLMKALNLIKKGGQIVCILNHETLHGKVKSPLRIALRRKLEEYNADIETIEGAFSDAERKTNVVIDIVYINIPKQNEIEVDFDELSQALNFETTQEEMNELVHSDILKAIVQQYEYEAKLGLHIIDEYEKLKKFLPKVSDVKTGYKETELIKLHIPASEDNSLSLQNAYLRKLRYKYWEKFFKIKDIYSLMTYEVRERYLAKLNTFMDYDFNLSNIYQLRLELSQNIVSNIEEAIIKEFDNLTYEHSMGNNRNIHYYNGWKTNKACVVNKKIILPFYDLYDNRWNSWSFYRAKDRLSELEKIFNYLDNGVTNGGADVYEVVNKLDRHGYSGERVKCKYFDIKFKKKGTAHIFFTNEKLLKKFNLFAGKYKNLLPEDYGRKSYNEMSREEKEVVKEFEGVEEYKDTVQGSNYYLGTPNLIMLN